MSLFIVKGKLKKHLNFLVQYFVFLEFANKFPITAPTGDQTQSTDVCGWHGLHGGL